VLWILFLGSALVAYGVTKLSIGLSLKKGMLDIPNVRSSHSQPVPRMGGIGILAGFFLPLGALAVLGYLGFVADYASTRDVLLFVIAGAGMAITGLCDDLYRLNPAVKFLMQFVLAAAVMALGARVEILSFPLGGALALGLFAYPITILWLTGFANIFNFMDGINGMAAGTGLVYSGLFFFVAWRQGHSDLSVLGVLLAGSCFGFLFHNFPQARTFMGDTGSLFLGGVFALFVVRLAQRAGHQVVLIAMVIGVSLYLWDSGFTLLRRLRHHENIFQAHRSHLYQRLVQAGLSHAKVTALYLLLHSSLGALALTYLWVSESGRLSILALAALVLEGFTGAVYWLERRQGAPKPGGSGPIPDSTNQERS